MMLLLAVLREKKILIKGYMMLDISLPLVILQQTSSFSVVPRLLHAQFTGRRSSTLPATGGIAVRFISAANFE